MELAVNRRRVLAAAVFLSLAGVAFVAACSFPDVGFRDDGGADAADATLPADAGGGDAPITTVDGQGPDGAAPACGQTEKTCGVSCVSKLDPNHSCGMPSCDPCGGPAHGIATCDAGQCAVFCAAPWEDCNGDAADGCEANPKGGDPNNCGSCHATCGNGKFCNQGDAGCGDACAPGSTACGSACVNEKNDPLNCGSCSFACPSWPNATPVCNDGGCGYTCSDPYSDCNTIAQDGCEANLKADVKNCGKCKSQCVPGLNAGATCIDGTCKYGCLDGYTDCNGDVADGGDCACAAPKVCRSGACVTCGVPGKSCQKGSDCCSGNCPGVLNLAGVCIGCTCQ
jgi:hypothetical protein